MYAIRFNACIVIMKCINARMVMLCSLCLCLPKRWSSILSKILNIREHLFKCGWRRRISYYSYQTTYLINFSPKQTLFFKIRYSLLVRRIFQFDWNNMLYRLLHSDNLFQLFPRNTKQGRHTLFTKLSISCRHIDHVHTEIVLKQILYRKGCLFTWNWTFLTVKKSW